MTPSQQMISQDKAVDMTRHWIEKFVIGHNFCPYAQPVYQLDSIRYVVSEDTSFESSLMHVMNECRWLDKSPETETTLIIFSRQFNDFDEFLTLIELADNLLDNYHLRGIYQLAHFHPDYCFADSVDSDPANYTNRSPLPTLHLLREASIEKALRALKLSESVTTRNIRYANEIGLNVLKKELSDCINK